MHMTRNIETCHGVLAWESQELLQIRKLSKSKEHENCGNILSGKNIPPHGEIFSHPHQMKVDIKT
jgi:hypothetical protein